MNYQHTANNLASQGRNGDSMLMHVTPREVSGLQALAQQHGGSLTVNPQTGLPEANILDDIGLGGVNKFVPAIAGAGLSFFSGGTIDPMTAAGMVGGLAGLSSGSLKEGIMAGLGAYGGASMTGALGAMGGASNATAAAQAADAGATGPLSGAAFNNVASAPDVGAGFDAATGSFGAAKDFLKDNKWAIGAAALPALESAMEQPAEVGPLKNKGYIRRYEKNPETGALEQVEAVPVDEWGDRPAVSFGGVGKPAQYAAGGAVAFDDGGAVKFGGVGASTNVRDPNDTRTDSQKAYDYLMGVPGAKNPMMFRHAAPVTPVVKPAVDTTSAASLAAEGLAGLEAQQQKIGGGSRPENNTGGGYAAPSSQSTAEGLASAGIGYGNMLGGFMPGGMLTGALGRAYVEGRLNKAALEGGYTGTYTGDAAFGPDGINNIATEGGLGPLSGGEVSGGFNATPADASTGIASLSTANQSQATQAQAQAQAETQARQAAEQAARETQAREAAAQAQAKALAEQSAAESARLAAKEQAAQAAAQAQAQAQAEQSAREQAAREAARAAEAQMAAQAQAAAAAQAGSQRGGTTVGGYAPGSQAGAAAASGTVGGYGPGTPGFGGGRGGDSGGGRATGGGEGGGSASGGGDRGTRGGWASGGITALAAGGLGSLGGYSDGGQLLRGPGDGVSDSIPATIGQGQPARLADGEFVVPARIVSELGNGSTEAGAKQLYAMMARIQAGRAKTTGKKQVAKNSKADRHLPA